MKVQNKSRSKFIKFLNGKAFYAVLSICLIAVGVAAWSGLEGFKRFKENQSDNNDVGEVTSSTEDTLSTPFDILSKNETADLPSKPLESSKPQSSSSTESKPETEQVAAPVANFFVSPVLGKVLKGYSASELQYSMTMLDMRLHKAVDIVADVGTPVVAAGEGVVKSVTNDAMFGTTVIIDHGNGITVKYCGLNSKPTVKEGDTVDSTTCIGSVDIIPCESVEQRHLHIEFFKNGESVSPLDYISP